MIVETKEIRITGDPISRGIALGPPFIFTLIEEAVPQSILLISDLEGEIARYLSAISRAQEEVFQLQAKLEKEKIFEGASILDTHLQILQDSAFTTEIVQRIKTERKNSEYLLFCTMEEYRKKFHVLSDPLFRERYQDLQDIYRRIIRHLLHTVKISLSNIPPGSIVFSHTLAISDVAEAEMGRVSGFVIQEGSATSHAAIVAKARGIPLVTNVDFSFFEQGVNFSVAIVDGRSGEVILNPGVQTLRKYKGSMNQLQLHFRSLQKGMDLPAETFDGYHVQVFANIDMLSEVDILKKHGACGVGLFRTEYICQPGISFPSEEEQYQIYRYLITQLKGLPITIRTFDVGGDKFSVMGDGEENPFLGCRAIRFLLREREVFLTQLRAILRAGLGADISLMFPMISTLAELIEAKKMVEQARISLREDGIPFIEKIRIGCMIEVPSAAIIADCMAQECDFLSIGTNDLVQYALAVDRSNHALKNLYAPTDLSVIRLIKHVVSEATIRGVPVGICGEIAADPRFTPLLLGLGLQQLSVAPRYIPIIKHTIRNTSIIEACQLAEQLLLYSDAKQILDQLTILYRKNCPDDCLYNY